MIQKDLKGNRKSKTLCSTKRNSGQKFSLAVGYIFLGMCIIYGAILFFDDWAHQGSVVQQTSYRASHILVHTEDEAQRLIQEIENGADFGELAQIYSNGPSRSNGGDLGWFSAGMMTPPFEEAVSDLEIGEISPPVETNFGWHVIYLTDIRNSIR